MKIIAVVLALYLSYGAALYLFQRRMIYPRQMVELRSHGPDAWEGFHRFWIQTADARCEAWLFFPPDGAAGCGKTVPAVILAHGNAESIDFLAEEFGIFLDLGMALLVVEYPGYGRSTGTPSQKSITGVFLAAFDRLTARSDIDSDKIVLVGRSLGGGVACALASLRPSAALVLISSFTSLRAFAPKYLVPGFLVRDPFDNLAVVSGYDKPVLVVHGRKDAVIPFAHGETLARSASRGRLMGYDCGHNDCPPDREAFRGELKAFLDQAGIV